MASDSDSLNPPDSIKGSFLNWFFLFLVVLGASIAIFVWLGGVRLVKRWMSPDGRKGKGKPNTRRDGYIRVDLEK